MVSLNAGGKSQGMLSRSSIEPPSRSQMGSRSASVLQNLWRLAIRWETLFPGFFRYLFCYFFFVCGEFPEMLVGIGVGSFWKLDRASFPKRSGL